MAEFWAGWVSGVAAIIVGNPLDIIKVRLQAQSPSRPVLAEPTLLRYHHAFLASSPSGSLAHPTAIPSPITKYFQVVKHPVTGTAAPILGSALQNGVLFGAYHLTEDALNRALSPSGVGGSTTGSNLWTVWLAGAAGGVAACFITTPTELIKCRAQLASPSQGPTSNPTPGAYSSSSWRIAKSIWRNEGLRGFYRGGVVTTLRDGIGYGFYFWTYQLSGRLMTSLATNGIGSDSSGSTGSTRFLTRETVNTLLCGGVAGVVSWASIYPLDLVKTRVQRQAYSSTTPNTATTLGADTSGRMGAVQIAKEAYREGGMRVFFKGLGWCSLRAFCVNAVQWFVYEQIVLQLDQNKRNRRNESIY